MKWKYLSSILEENELFYPLCVLATIQNWASQQIFLCLIMNPFHIDIWLDERISALQVQPSSCSVVQKQRSSGRMRTIENKCRIKLNTNKIRILLKHSKYLFCVKEKRIKTRDPHFCLVSQIIRIMRIYHETKMYLFLHEV